LSRNYWADPAAREKKRQQRCGQKWDVATKDKIASTLKGKPKSEAHRAALREAMRRVYANPELRQKQAEIQKEAQRRPEVRLKKSQALAGRRRRKDKPQ
jgi:hypothetical protein